MTSRLKPRRSIQRRYMRSSISAQSCDSVPPAPGWIVTIAFLRSCSPPSIFLVSPASTCVDELVEGAAEIVGDRLARFGPLDEHVEIVEPASERRAQLAILLEPAAALQQLLRAGLILPEVRSGDAFFDSGELGCGAGGVKDGSAGRRRVAPGPRTCEAVRPVAMAIRLTPDLSCSNGACRTPMVRLKADTTHVLSAVDARPAGRRA